MTSQKELYANKFKELSQEQIERVLRSDMKDTHMRYGVEIIRHCDTTLTMIDLFTIEGVEKVFSSLEEAADYAKSVLLSYVTTRTQKYVVGSMRERDGKIEKTYLEGLRGVGQYFGWWSTYDVWEARWFDTIEDAANMIKRYGLECGAMFIEKVGFYKIYKDETGKYLPLDR